MYTLKYGSFTIQYTLSKGNVCIIDSYKIRKKADMNGIVKAIRAEALKKGFKYKRTDSSWVTEWRAHNYMYDKGQERSRTKSVDLNENESKLKLLSYTAMSLRYKG